jgi:hypothetical protein
VLLLQTPAGSQTPLSRSMLSRSVAGTAKQGAKSTMSFEQAAYAKVPCALLVLLAC